VFWPVPQVDSAIVDIVPNRTRLDRIRDYGSFHRIARAIFNHRRKTLLGSFDAERLLRPSGRDAAQAIIDAGFDPQVRGEKLSVDAMINLANALSERDLLSD
jgi:16S rRNA (adenine1518-N6/adenine1519-N6)-dimethyltransferase